jgi:hypothetical protein
MKHLFFGLLLTISSTSLFAADEKMIMKKPPVEYAQVKMPDTFQCAYKLCLYGTCKDKVASDEVLVAKNLNAKKGDKHQPTFGIDYQDYGVEVIINRPKTEQYNPDDGSLAEVTFTTYFGESHDWGEVKMYAQDLEDFSAGKISSFYLTNMHSFSWSTTETEVELYQCSAYIPKVQNP